eukprot:2168898-Pyramimonas_sp.AAC.1
MAGLEKAYRAAAPSIECLRTQSHQPACLPRSACLNTATARTPVTFAAAEASSYGKERDN